MDILRKEYDLTTENKAEPRLREDCIDNGLVRENGEEWYDVTNKRCVCQVRKFFNMISVMFIRWIDTNPLHLVSKSENCQKYWAQSKVCSIYN